MHQPIPAAPMPSGTLKKIRTTQKSGRVTNNIISSLLLSLDPSIQPSVSQSVPQSMKLSIIFYDDSFIYSAPTILLSKCSVYNIIIMSQFEHETISEMYFTLSRSGWAPLLLTLMYEYTNPTSYWKPYLNLVPDVAVLDQPMFWGLEERQKELQGTGIEEDVESDIQHIEQEYNVIVLPFIKKHPELFRYK